MKLILSTALLASAAAQHHRGASGEVALWGQCGGKEYTGDTKCAAGSTCVYSNEWWSQCQPGGDDGSVGAWGKCGGKDHTGSTKCATGSSCKKWNDEYSQCIPDEKPTTQPQRGADAREVEVWGQCGGKNYTGDTKCAPGSKCVVSNEWWSQCQPGGDDGSVGAWGQCGGKDYKGSTTCASGSTCKKWGDDYSQCVPSTEGSKSGDTKPTDDGALPTGWLKLPGFQWTLLGNDDTVTEAKNLADCTKDADKPSSDGSIRNYAVWSTKESKCHVASTVYTYTLNADYNSAFKYNPDNYECFANSEYTEDTTATYTTRASRCLDSCDNLAFQSQGCNAVTYVRKPGDSQGTCYIKVLKNTGAAPVANKDGAFSCKRKK